MNCFKMPEVCFRGIDTATLGVARVFRGSLCEFRPFKKEVGPGL
jgi:hypothetical protein